MSRSNSGQRRRRRRERSRSRPMMLRVAPADGDRRSRPESQSGDSRSRPIEMRGAPSRVTRRSHREQIFNHCLTPLQRRRPSTHSVGRAHVHIHLARDTRAGAALLPRGPASVAQVPWPRVGPVTCVALVTQRHAYKGGARGRRPGCPHRSVPSTALCARADSARDHAPLRRLAGTWMRRQTASSGYAGGRPRLDVWCGSAGLRGRRRGLDPA